MRIRVVTLSALLVLGACARGTLHVSSTPGLGTRAAPQHGLLGGAELVRLRDTPSLYAAIEQSRPRFLQPRPTFVSGGRVRAHTSVFVNGHYVGGVESLRTLPVDAVASVRFLQPMEAYAQFGQRHGVGGAIVVTTR